MNYTYSPDEQLEYSTCIHMLKATTEEDMIHVYGRRLKCVLTAKDYLDVIEAFPCSEELKALKWELM